VHLELAAERRQPHRPPLQRVGVPAEQAAVLVERLKVGGGAEPERDLLGRLSGARPSLVRRALGVVDQGLWHARWSMHPGRRPEMGQFARRASANVNAVAVPCRPCRPCRAGRAVPAVPCRPCRPCRAGRRTGGPI
jgi:hypothetical protein